MGKSFCSTATTGNVAAATTRLCPISAINVLGTVEQRVQSKFYGSGTFANYNCFVSTNTTTASSSVNFRKNGANGNCTLSIPAATTGYFSDTVNSDSIVSGDLVNSQIVNGGGGAISIPNITCEFSPSSGTVSKLMTIADVNFSTASVTQFVPVNGSNVFGATEGNVQTIIRTAGTQRNMFLFIRVNTRTTTSTVRNRINGADGNLVVSIPASTTGVLEDTTNSNSIADGDLINYSLTTGTGTGNLNITILQTDLETTNEKFALIGGIAAGNSINITTRFFVPTATASFSVESQASVRVPFACTVRNLGVEVSSNATTGSSTVDVRINSASSAITLSVPAGTTGYFEDTVNSASVAVNDTLSIRIVGGSGGAAVWNLHSLIGETSAPAPSGGYVWSFIM